MRPLSAGALSNVIYRADLHCHTSFSDGTSTPFELLRLAKQEGLSGICITDHDTFGAYTPNLFVEAKKIGIDLFVGVEFSTSFEKKCVHVLGYGVDLNDDMRDLCQMLDQSRKERNQSILKCLQRFDILIEDFFFKRFANQHTIGRMHVAQCLVEKGYVQNIQEAFDRYIGDAKPCFVSAQLPPIDDVIDRIHLANGKAFLAHPHLLSHKIKDALLTKNFDGIECYYGLFDARFACRWVNIAEKKGWLISGGSDFHGSFKPQFFLGSSWVGLSDVEKIFR